MGLWHDRVLAPLIATVMRHERLTRYRRQLIPAATGDIVEIGIGSGLNLPFYGDGVSGVRAVDPSAPMQRWAARAGRGERFPVDVVQAPAEALPFETASADTVISTWTLCSVADPARALAEVRRVLKPGGRFLLVEHGLAPEGATARWQRRINPVWRPCSGGCNINRPIERLLTEGGFDCTHLEKGFDGAPAILTYMTWGAAVPR